MLAIVAVLVFIWMYRAAVKHHSDNVWKWATLGVFSYYVTGIIWIYGLLKPMMGRSFYHLSPMEGVVLELSGIIIALLVVFLIKLKFLSS